MHKADIAVIGAGPAGAAAAQILAQRGRLCVMLEPGGPPKPGEALYPGANPLLAQLGMTAPQEEGRTPSPGVIVRWRGHRREHDFILSPFGHGWNLDRTAFEHALRAKAVAAGAVPIAARFYGVESNDGRFILHAQGKEGAVAIAVNAVIDASGRAAVFARRMGARREMQDRLIALHQRAPAIRDDRRLVVESAEEGWWYALGLSSGAVRCFLTRESNARTPPPPPAAIAAHGAGIAFSAPTRHAAGSSRLDRLVGKNWVALGDAAIAHDPLSGHGIAAALASGIEGAAAIDEALRGDVAPLRAYEERRNKAWPRYREGLTAQYAALAPQR